MEKDYTILHYGISGVYEKWALSLNKASLVDRVYYILEEGAGYIAHGRKNYFIKNHVYIINHNADIEYFAEDFGFRHAFIDYMSEGAEGYGEVLEIPLQNNPLIKCDVETMLCFLETDKGRNEEAAIFPYSERLLLILRSILCDAGELFETAAVKNPIAAAALKYIHENFTEEISIKTLAEKAHLSRNQFSRIFLRYTGFTPYQYIKEYRLNMALAMLRKGISVGEVAQKCAFLSTSAFSSSFKKKFGESPNGFIAK